MLEALVNYITEKGFAVVVRPGMLHIAKKAADGTLCNAVWAIPHIDMQYLVSRKEILFEQADSWMCKVNQAIIEHDK